MSTLAGKLGSSAIWMLITRLLVKSLGIISSLILVRLLTPEDFGVIAIVMSIYSFIELFGLFGFNAAIIQKTAPQKSDYDTTFTINLCFGIIASSLMFFMASHLASFFDDQRLIEVFRWVALMFLFNALINIKVVDFQRDMNFKKELILQLVPKLFSFFVTLFLAWHLRNYLALVYGMLALSLFNVIQSYIMKPYSPSLSMKGGKELFRFSKWLMLNNIFYYINNKSIDLIVGKMISTKAAGLYSISQEMATLPVSEIGAPINKASYPAYSKAKDNLKELTLLFYSTCSMITILALPAALGLFSVSDFFVPVVLGEKWIGAIEVIQLLSLAAFVTSLSSNNGYIYMAIGKPKITTMISGIRIIILLIMLFGIISFDNISSPALALLCSAIINFFISFSWLKFEIHISFRSMIAILYRPALSSLIMSIMIWVMKSFYIIDVDFLNLMLLIAIGVITYVSCILFFWWAVGKPKGIEMQILSKLKLS
ncbi:lipopolysaccharide biosynthesis protein [Colwellia sp. 6_MG-2023]|uniref:lipopolysaccharide biosynthesis protein n=1 Tax=Colwellia sp. 6_MG-2023 TaxID=3062676 RepID=UPI0026E2EF90|nr:lipopolysaccharide biosynthesis protein [Colwellia sp. 6_MG-2023]MDO6487713.1 lipopolysaccharide biosynthesis protein [Colwellia sp. 6_MG-2023]